MRKILLPIMTILLLTVTAYAQDMPEPSEIEIQRQMANELRFLREKTALLEQQNKLLAEAATIYENLLSLKGRQVDFLQQAIEQRKEVEQIYDAKLALKDQEIALYKEEARIMTTRAEKAEKSKNRSNILFGIVGVIFGHWLR